MPNSSRILSGSDDGGIQLWDYDTGDAILRLTGRTLIRNLPGAGSPGEKSRIVASNSGEVFATAGDHSDKRVRIWK